MNTNPAFPLTDSTGTVWSAAQPKRTLTPLVRKPQPDMPTPNDLFDRHPLLLTGLIIAGVALGCAMLFVAVML